MVITGLTRNQFAGNSGTWVRIPPTPPSRREQDNVRACFDKSELPLILLHLFLSQTIYVKQLFKPGCQLKIMTLHFPLQDVYCCCNI